MEYKEFYQQMHNMAMEQTIRNRDCRVDGKRVVIPLEGRDIETIIYCKNPTAPIVFCAYGGGFVMGACALDNNLWNTLHEKFDVTIISIGYRRAPKYPFPSGLSDVYDSIAYIEEHQKDFGLDSNDFSVYGNSAGGNLVTGVCRLDLKLGGKLHLKRQILNYPYCDVATKPEEKGHCGQEIFMYEMFRNDYCARDELTLPLVSPVYSEVQELIGMPRTIITLAGDDPLHAEGARYAYKLRAAGVEVDLHTADGMGHGYTEIWFQGMNGRLSDIEKKKMLDGSMERESMKTIEYIKSKI